MIRKLFAGMRQVLLPPSPIRLAVLGWLTIELLRHGTSWWFGVNPVLFAFQYLRDAWVLLASFNYGRFRATHFHPFYQDDYRHWLEATPWAVERPLPLGPLQIVWQDGIVLLVLVAAMYDVQLKRVWVPLLFVVPYASLMAASFLDVGLRAFGYGLFFLMGLAIRLDPYPRAQLAVDAAIVVVSWLGARAMLRAFP